MQRIVLSLIVAALVLTASSEAIEHPYWFSSYVHKPEQYWPFIRRAEKTYHLFYPLDKATEVDDPDTLYFRFVSEEQGTLAFARRAAFHLCAEFNKCYAQSSRKKLLLSIQFKKQMTAPENAHEYVPLSVRSERDLLVYILKKGNSTERWRYIETLQEAQEWLSKHQWQQPNPKKLVQLQPNLKLSTSGLWND